MKLLGRLFGRGETGRSETAMVRSRYRSLLIPIAEVESASRLRISVASLLDLAQLAKRERRSLFVRDFDNAAQVYFMHDGLVIYQYAVGDVPQDWIHSAVASSEEPALSTREEVPVSALGVPVFKHEAFVSPQEASTAFPPVVEASPLASPYEEEQPPAPVTETVDEESDEAKFVEPIPEWLLAPSGYDEPENADEEVLQFSSGNGPAHESPPVPAGVGQPGAPADNPEALSSVHNDGSDAPKFAPATEEPQAAEASREELSNGFADLVWKRPSESETVAASLKEIVVAELASQDPETPMEVAREPLDAEVESAAEAESEQSVDGLVSLPEVWQFEDASEPRSVSDTSESAGSETSLIATTTRETPPEDSRATSLALESVEESPKEAMQPETEAVITVSEAYSQPVEVFDVTDDMSAEQESIADTDDEMSVEVKTFGPTEDEAAAADPRARENDVSPPEENESVNAFEPVSDVEDGARFAQSSRTRGRRQPLEKKLARYAKKWLRDFLDY